MLTLLLQTANPGHVPGRRFADCRWSKQGMSMFDMIWCHVLRLTELTVYPVCQWRSVMQGINTKPYITAQGRLSWLSRLSLKAFDEPFPSLSQSIVRRHYETTTKTPNQSCVHMAWYGRHRDERVPLCIYNVSRLINSNPAAPSSQYSFAICYNCIVAS